MSVVVEEYNPLWPAHFQQIRSELASYLKGVSVKSIEHVGSTSVPGLAAKPIIDVDIIVSRENLGPAIDALVQNGSFTYLGELGIKDRHALRDPKQSPQRNTYICIDGAFQTRNHLALRDTLRTNTALREEYADVKRGLAARGVDIVDYLKGKGGIIQKILKESGILTEEELNAIDAANTNVERIGATKTAKLTLREFVTSDVDGYYELESDPDVVRYQTFEPFTYEQAKKQVFEILRDSACIPRQHIELAVTHENQLIGRVGAMLDPNSGKDGQPHLASLWFSFMPKWQGKGYATEAVEKFIELLGRRPLTLEIECDPRNTRSVKMAERLGFERVTVTERAYESKGEMVDSWVFRKSY
jgi:GrpB-like predicted nucleotidyltransferase (UPF0157 family)/RimJ/RimL family protein N-acetyltransferase